MAKWHTVQAGSFDDDQSDRELVNQGPLISIAREPPQNTTDNILNKDTPVVLRYSFREIPSTPDLRDRYLPQNPWVDHVTAPQNQGTTSYREDYGESLLDSISHSVRVLLVEDYNATGLEGDPNMLFPNTIGEEGEYDRATKENTFFWFMRSKGAKRPVDGRGGSWGLGKLAFPLASAVRTFFVVTSRTDGSRYLAGQAVLKNHEFRGNWYADMMYFADDEKIGDHDKHWGAISDTESIADFCATFQVERRASQPGTSMVIPLPKADLDHTKLTLCLISNYCVPILRGKLEIEVSPEEGIVERITAKNVREWITRVQWDLLPRSLLAGWSTSGRMDELVNLYDSIDDAGSPSITTLTLGEPIQNKKPNTAEQYERVLPDRDSEKLQEVRDAYLANQPIVVLGEMPVHHKDERGIQNGSYCLAFRKCEDENAEAHFYRHHISLPMNLERKAAPPGVSSLLVVGDALDGSLNPLAEMLRNSEGPAHLKWYSREIGMTQQYTLGPSTISFLKEIVGKIVSRITSVDTQREDIWTDIFSLGEKPEPPEIERRFRIVEHEGGGCTITPLESKEDLVGISFIIRAGYPKPFNLKLKKPPDSRAIDIHAMSWNAEGATITKDVVASNGELCVDRVRMTINAPEFEVELLGVNTELKAQVILTEEAGM